MEKSIPRTIASFLFLVLNVLSKPQRKHCLVYLIGLIWMIKFRSIRSIAEAYGNKRVDGLHQFLHGSPQKTELLEEANQQAVVAAVGIQPACLVIDDTPCPRNGKHIEGLAIHHGADGLVKGLCAVTAIVKAGARRFVFAVRGYRPKKVCPSGEFKSKVQLALDLLERAQHLFCQRLTVLIDSWYTCAPILKRILAAQWIFLGALKCNRIVFVHGRKTAVRHLAKGPRSYKTIRVSKKKKFRVAKLRVYLPKVGDVLLFISKSGNKTRFFITSNLEMTEQEMVDLYGERYWIETFHREIKQYLGFGELFMRSWQGVQKHWVLVAIAYNLLVFWKGAPSKSFRQRIHQFRDNFTVQALLKLPKLLNLAA